MNLKFGIPCWSQRVRLSDQWRGEADVHVSTVANCHSTLDLLTTEYPVYIQARVAGDFCIFLFCSIVKSMVNLEWPTKTTLQMVERNAARDVCFSNLVISHVHEAHLYIRRSWLAGHCFFFPRIFFFGVLYRCLLYAMFVCIPISNSLVAPPWKRIQLLGTWSQSFRVYGSLSFCFHKSKHLWKD